MANDANKPVDDVSKPGTTTPDTSGKPIIVSHKPMIKDPMVNESSTDTDVPVGEAAGTTMSKETARVIEPLTKTDEKPEKAAENPEVPESEEAAVVDAVLDQKDSKKKATKESQDAQEKNDQIEKLIESKKYFVKVRAPKQKRNKRALIVVIIVAVLGIVGFGVAADAEIIPFEVPFDFIKQENQTTSDNSAAIQSSSAPTSKKSAQSEKNTKTKNPISSSGDLKRKTDIALVQSELEAYFSKQNTSGGVAGYPTLEQINNEEFVATNLRNILSQKVQDPDAKNNLFVSTPTAKAYSYEVVSVSGGTCDNVSITCGKYTITATLSDESLFTKTSIVAPEAQTEQ